MNFVTKLFRGETTMQAVAEPTEAELAARLAEVEKQIADGDGDMGAALEERERLRYQIQGAAIVRQKRQGDEYRAKINAAREKYIAEVQAEVAELWKIMPRLRWTLAGLSALEERDGVSGFDGKGFDEISGLHLGSARRMAQALAQELRGTMLQDEVGPEGTTGEPKAKPPRAEGTFQAVDRGATDLYGVPLFRPRTYL
jgi:hypothetical protein